MKHCTTLVALALSIALFAAAANATVIPMAGPNEGHLKDVSHHFTGAIAGQPGSGVPVATGHQITIGDEFRALFRVDDLELMGSPLGKYWLHQSTTGDELTGVLYDLAVSRIDPNGVIYYAPLGRNPLLPTDDADGDITAWPGAFGGVIELYQDATPDLDATLLSGAGPALWVPGSGPVRPSGTAADGYPTATDGTLGLSGVLLDLSAFGAGNPGEVYKLTPLGGGVYSGLGYMNVFDGLAAPMIAAGGIPMAGTGAGLADVAIHTSITLGTNVWSNPNWSAGSSDPMRFNVVPEPVTLTTVALGSILLLRIRRQH